MADINLVWDKAFKRRAKEKFIKMQEYIDTSCVKKMEPLVPVALDKFENAGKLRDSVKISKPGVIIYTAPFARSDYYATKNHQRGGNPQAQRMWFEAMKVRDADKIRKGAQKIANKKG